MIDSEMVKIFSQFGFGGLMAFTFLYILYNLGNKVIDSNKDISLAHKADMKELASSHKKDLKEMAELHRDERKECYAHQKQQIEKFDQTIRMVTESVKK